MDCCKCWKLTKEQWIWAILRIGIGWIFLWAFLDKLFGLGFTTEAGKSWLDGASPTAGFLQFGTKGPFAGLYHAMAGSALVDWIFMLGLLLIGLSLLLGIGVKIAGYSGALLMLLMYTAAMLPEHNPLLDDHIIYGVLLVGMTFVPSGRWLGFGKCWEKTKLVKKHSWLA